MLLDTPDFFYQVLTMLRSESRYRGFAIPRGFSKTTLLSEIYPIYNIVTRSRIYQVLVGQSLGKAVEVIEAIKVEFETNAFLKFFYGDMVGENYHLTWSSKSLSFPNTTKIKGYGLGQSIRGTRYMHYRPDLINCDDLEEDKYIKNPEYRKANKSWLLRQVLPTITDNGEINVFGTILHDDSLVQNIIDKKEEFSSWDTILLKAIQKDNTPLWPERISLETAHRMQHDPDFKKFCGTLTFSQEYQNEPINDLDRIIKSEWIDTFRYSDLVNEYRAKTGEDEKSMLSKLEVYGGVDTAISKKDTADYFTFITILYDKNGILREKGMTYVVGYIRTRASIDRQAEIIINNFLTWEHTLIKIETVAYQEALKQYVVKKAREKGLTKLVVRGFKPDKDKIRRLTAKSARIENRLVKFRSDDPLWVTMRDELLMFPSMDHDDMVDGFMMADDCIAEQKTIRTWASKPEGF